MPDDPDIEDMDPIMRLYMQFHWYEDKVEYKESLDNQAKFIGWFTNPEAASKMMNANKIETTDEEFDKVSNAIVESNKQQLSEITKGKKRRRKRRVVNG